MLDRSSLGTHRTWYRFRGDAHPGTAMAPRIAYAEICADEKAATAVAVLERAVAWFAERGVTVERVLSDNGSCYRSFAWRDACAELGIAHKRTRPTARRPTASASDFTGPWPTAGPTPASTTQKPSDEQRCPAGFTSTITTGSTPRSAAHPSAGTTTRLDITTRERKDTPSGFTP